MSRLYTAKEISRLHRYCKEGYDLPIIAERLGRSIAGIVVKLNNLAREEPSWRPFAKRYRGQYGNLLRQRPLDEADAMSLMEYLMQFPNATLRELTDIGYGKTLSPYSGRIKLAKMDAETEKFQRLLASYSELRDNITREVGGKLREYMLANPELGLIHALFGGLPYFNVMERIDKYLADYLQYTPFQRGVRYESTHPTGSIESRFEKEIEHLLEGGQLRGMLDEVLGLLNPREKRVLELRFLEEKKYTLEEIGNLPEFNVSINRIRQIEAKALRKLRSPSRSNKIRKYFLEKRIGLIESGRYESSDPDVVLLFDITQSLQHELDSLERELRLSIEPKEQRLYRMDIGELGIPSEVIQPLSRHGIKTVGQLLEQSGTDIFMVRQVGERKIERIKFALGKIGLALKDSLLHPFPSQDELHRSSLDLILSGQVADRLGKNGIETIGDLVKSKDKLPSILGEAEMDEVTRAIKFYEL